MENIRNIGRRTFETVKKYGTRENLQRAIGYGRRVSGLLHALEGSSNRDVARIAKKVPVEKLDQILGVADTVESALNNKGSILGKSNPPAVPILHNVLPSEQKKQQALDRLTLAQERLQARRAVGRR